MKRKVKHYKALTLDELHDIYRNRVSVFVVEQNCPYQEIDGNDKVSCICSWITDHEGIADQRLQYLPFETPFANQYAPSAGYSERFTFTGKEKDEETGYGYFGARYMDHELMTMWLSVDPMADKYPNISPYVYCAWNPVKLVDPNGLFADDPPTSLRYIIRKGDSFWSLENEWNLPHGTLRSINPSIDPDKIQIGQEINAARNEGNYIVVGNTVHIPEGREAKPPNEEGPSGLMYLASGYDFLSFRMAFDALLPWMTFGIIEGPVGGQHIPKITFGGSCRPIRGLGNPFKNMNLTEIDNRLQRYVRQGKMEPAKGCAPGNKAYVTKKTRYSYNLDPVNAKESPHVDVNYPHGSHRVKKKLSTSGGFKND